VTGDLAAVDVQDLAVMKGDDSRNRMPSKMSLTWPTRWRGCRPASAW